eukprot:COSAG03_NODE_29632_length_180_cov_30.049383_1_plen_43_part_10
MTGEVQVLVGPPQHTHIGMPEIAPLCDGLFDPTSNATYAFLAR